MVAAGYMWFEQAQSAVLAHLSPSGIAQAKLGPRMGLSKQAVHQLIDTLESDGIVIRVPDPLDGRGKRVVLTEAGLRLMRAADSMKAQIETDYRDILGWDSFSGLEKALKRLQASNARKRASPI